MEPGGSMSNHKGFPIIVILNRINSIPQIDTYYTLLEKYSNFFFAKTRWISMKRTCISYLEPSYAYGIFSPCQQSVDGKQHLNKVELSSNFHCKENYGTTGAAHLIQTFLAKNQTPVVRQAPYSHDIRRYRQKV